VIKKFTRWNALLLALLAAVPALLAAPAEPKNPIPPTQADLSYGTDPAQKFDLYLPTAGAKPFPVFIWYHGGGWSRGDKSTSIPDLTKILGAGCAVISVDYRLLPDLVKAGINPPIPAVMADHRRSLQYIRLHAADWGLDPTKIVVGGVSAGACSALYLGAEGEQANPQSTDPVEQVSTLVLGVVADRAQTTIDPQQMRAWVPRTTWGCSIFNYQPDEFEKLLAERDKWMPFITKYSPDYLLTSGAPPIFFSFTQPVPPPNCPVGTLVHCPLWAIGYQKLAQSKGVTCYLQYPGHPPEKFKDATEFLLSLLGLSK
jgi:acetyl esterase/lipase